jgi:hypothetical protein
MTENDFIYPYSSQYISRLNHISMKRNEQSLNQQRDILNARASGGFTIPIQPAGETRRPSFLISLLLILIAKPTSYILSNKNMVGDGQQRGRSGSVKKRPDTSSSIEMSANDVKKSTNKLRSNSVDLKRQRTPNRALTRPVLQQNVSMFDGWSFTLPLYP